MNVTGYSGNVFATPKPMRSVIATPRFGKEQVDSKQEQPADNRTAPTKNKPKRSWAGKIGTLVLAAFAGVGGSAIHDSIKSNFGAVSVQQQNQPNVRALVQTDKNVTDRDTIRQALVRQREASKLDSVEDHLNLLSFYVKPAVVKISTDNSIGSGFFVRSNGYIVTNAHVVDGEDGKPLKTVTVETYNGRRLTGEVRGVNKEKDLAVVKVDIEDAVPLSLARNDPTAGDLVATMGHPLGITYFMSFGIVGANNKTLFFRDAGAPTVSHLSDAQFNPGISGGPMVNLNGDVVGVNRAMIPGDGGFIGVSIPATELARELESLMNGSPQS